MKQLFKYFFKLLGYEIHKINPIQSTVLKNVFKSAFEKKVLISYIKGPFVEGIKYHHSNYLECHTAADIFHNLTYQVDIVDLNFSGEVSFGDYDIIYGMGQVLENSFYYQKNAIHRIYYGTGCCPSYSNLKTIEKIKMFRERTNVLMPESGRIVPFSQDLQHLLSDSVIVLGNQDVLNTYLLNDNDSSRYSTLNAFYFDVYDIDLTKKDFDLVKKNFIWFGSTGLLHKGLDTLLEIFMKRDDINLFICGGSDAETGFWDYYKPLIAKARNIHFYGFVNLFTDQFKHLMDNTATVIYPSISEGGSPALLNVMANGGLIPVVSRMSGIDEAQLGYVLENNSEDEINNAINAIINMKSEDLLLKSLSVKNAIREKYTFLKYKKNLQKCIESSIENAYRDKPA